MPAATKSPIPALLERHEADVLEDWIREQLSAATLRSDLIKAAELREQSRTFLHEFKTALQSDNLTDLQKPEWSSVKELLTGLSRSRARQGFSPTETGMFVLSLKQPVFALLRQNLVKNEDLADALWATTVILDKLALFTTEVFQRSREETISRQQEELLELSTPVVQLWQGVLALPIIGTLDSKRTQLVMEALLQRIVETGSEVAIIDITGVPTVDTLTAQHLLKTITAARLMGADCIISGIRPQIAQTVVHLGVDLAGVVTKSSMAGALALALARQQLAIVKVSNSPATGKETGG